MEADEYNFKQFKQLSEENERLLAKVSEQEKEIAALKENSYDFLKVWNNDLEKQVSEQSQRIQELVELVKDLRPMIGNRDFIQKNDRFYSMQARIDALLTPKP